MTGQTIDNTETDALLVARIAEGDATSLGALYDRHNLVAYRVALCIVHDRGRAEDAVHDAFLSVWRKGGSYTPGRGTVKSWLLGIVRNRAIDMLRARRGSEMDDEATLLALRDAGPSVLEQVSAKLEGDAIQAALRQLPLGQQQAIANAFFAGLSHSEIAATTGLPLGTVHGRIRLGLRGLRRHLLAAGVVMPSEGIGGPGAVTSQPSPQQPAV